MHREHRGRRLQVGGDTGNVDPRPPHAQGACQHAQPRKAPRFTSRVLRSMAQTRTRHHSTSPPATNAMCSSNFLDAIGFSMFKPRAIKV